MVKRLVIALCTTLTFSSPAFAQIIVSGGGKASACYQKTKHNDPGRKSTIQLCEEALSEEPLIGKNRAATHINTAILYMRSEAYAEAQSHFNEAISLKPELPEAYISLAANHIYQGDYAAAIDAVTIGIDLGTEKMPEALYNRAIAYDRLEQYSLAYKDLKQALVLKPDWEDAIKALSRYDVVTKPG